MYHLGLVICDYKLFRIWVTTVVIKSGYDNLEYDCKTEKLRFICEMLLLT